jgi:hypothetical protein
MSIVATGDPIAKGLEFVGRAGSDGGGENERYQYWAPAGTA